MLRRAKFKIKKSFIPPPIPSPYTEGRKAISTRTIVLVSPIQNSKFCQFRERAGT